MKRILLFAAVAASLFVSCKGKEDPNATARAETRRSFFDTLTGLSTEDRITWLKSKESIICSTYLDSIADSHQLDSLRIAQANSQMGSANVRTLTLNDILNGAACNYDKYIAFQADSTGAISVEPNSDYSEDYSCYSRPLFHGLQKKYNLSGATQFHFFEATLSGVNGKTVVFKIDKVNDAFFDFSKWPALITNKNPL